MTLETSVYKFPSPVDAEAPNGPAEFLALAEKLEATKWLSQSLKPTTGSKQATGSSLALTTSYQDITNTTLEITPVVASVIRIWAVFGFSALNLGAAPGEGKVVGTVGLDAVDQTAPLAGGLQIGANSVFSGSFPANFSLALTAAKHTIKLRAKKETGGPESALMVPAFTHYIYDLVAS